MMRATYRLQLTPDFGFDHARAQVPYLRDLGVSHLYLSPIMQARRGSTHGYDVTNPTVVSDELGGETAFRELVATARAAGLGVIVDFVPNHMAASEENPYWGDPELRSKFFDIDSESGWHRRFFTIDELAGVRVEDPEVFEETHRKILELVHEGLVEGLRIDHPDGLADPATYLRRLDEAGVEAVWVEKILEAGEQLRDWPVEGTTGYEFANDVTALFVNPDAEGELNELYRSFTGHQESFEEVAAAAKLEQAKTAFAPELKKLRSLYDYPDLEAAVASLHVYRSYIRPSEDTVDPEDETVLEPLPADLRHVMLRDRSRHEEFVTRFQQTTGPVMAKGVEDTAFYRYLRLTALNEVGGDPGRFSLSVDEFHRANELRATRFPDHMLASQTHDTKRSGDVRARIAAISEFATEWSDLIDQWHQATEDLRTGPGPDPNEEYLIYQTLIGTWPIADERICAYLEKALREAKLNTNWETPDEEWERSVKDFATGLSGHGAFRSSFEPFLAKLLPVAEQAALGALLLRLTAPGFADLYQGDELADFSLVDPDNRRPVDWETRRRMLSSVDDASGSWDARKIALIRETLALRAQRPDAFAGSYTRLQSGPAICAFLRGEEVAAIVSVARDAGLPDVQLPAGDWRDVLDRSVFTHLRLLARAT